MLGQTMPPTVWRLLDLWTWSVASLHPQNIGFVGFRGCHNPGVSPMFSTGTSMFSIRVRQKSPYGAIGAKEKPWVPAFQEDSIGVEAVPSPSASRLDGAVTERGAPGAWDATGGSLTLSGSLGISSRYARYALWHEQVLSSPVRSVGWTNFVNILLVRYLPAKCWW